jgi:hypothetical protein
MFDQYSQRQKRQRNLRKRCVSACVAVAVSVGCCLATSVQAQPVAEQLRTEMGEDRFLAAGLHKLTEEELLHLRLFILDAGAAGVLPPEDTEGLVAQRRKQEEVSGVDDLEGGSIVAQDGTFLGRIDRSRLSDESLSNRIGDYGSKISNDSILNKIGPYGSRISDLSPFNRIAKHPPKVFDKDGDFVGYLTVNKLINPRIDPNTLLDWLGLK